ncbi:hydrogenase iron-sulfur subunit [Archaeoglobus sp.]
MPEERPKTILVDYNKCISCGICVSLCPQDALELRDGVPEVVGKCKVCGLCAASCITRAIEMSAAKFKEESILAEIVPEKKIVVFSCRRNIEKDKDYDASVVSLLCSSRLDAYFIAEAFAKGAEGVVVATCGESCRNYPGSAEVRSKVRLIEKTLEKLGESKDRILLVEGDFSDAIVKMKSKVSGKVEGAEIIRDVTLNRDVRALVAKMRTVTEVGNVYGEKVDYEKYDGLLDEIVDKAVKSAMILHYLNGGAKISEIVTKTGLTYRDVLDTVLEMKRKDLVELEVEEEVFVKAKG